MSARAWCIAGLALAAGVGVAAQRLEAQSLGTFRWQLQPFCNVVTVTVVQQGGVYVVDGYDDQCGAAQRAPLVGLATPNPDGSIGFGLHVVTVPGGRPVDIDARIALATLSGSWHDSAGNTGPFVFNGGGGGQPRPAPTIPGSTIAPGSITSAQIAAGVIGASHLAPGAVGAAAIAPGSISATQLAPGLVADTVAGFGTCPVGQYLRGILPSGTPVCEPIGTPPISTNVDTANVVGVYSAIAVGSDGLPIVAHHDPGAGDLRVTHCSNPACTAATSNNVDSGGGASGWFPAIAIGADGRAIIAHYDPVDLDLRVTHCTNVTCTSGTSTAVDTAGNVGQVPAIAIGSDGLAIISHFDATNQDLRVTHCDTPTCSSATTTSVATAGAPGSASSIAVAPDGRAVIAHSDLLTLALAFTRCSNAACTTATTIPFTGAIATDTGVVIGASGFPVVMHSVGQASVSYCDDAACATRTTVPVPAAQGGFSMAIGSDGAPVYATGGDFGGLAVVKCDTAACVATTRTLVDGRVDVGQFAGLAIGADGLPVVSHYDSATQDLRVTKCTSRACR